MEPLYPQRPRTDLIRKLAIASIAGQLAWLAIAIVGGLFFVAGNDPDGYYGLVQRLALAAGGGWVLLLSLCLLYIYRPAGGVDAEPVEPGHQARSPQSQANTARGNS